MAPCSVCATIIPAVQRNLSPNHDNIDLGTWKEYTERTDCAACSRIVEYLKLKNQHRSDGDFSLDCRLHLHLFLSSFLINSHCCGRRHPFLTILPAKSAIHPDQQHFLKIGTSAIDETRIKTWASYCDSNHSGHCHSLPSLQSVELASSLVFVDVISLCLTKSTGTERYLALSYVWGQLPDSLELNCTTGQTLFSLDALGEPHVKMKLPKTISDAMRLTAALGIRYLWVDRLCIFQDDVDQMDQTLQQMASIYANAYFTIIALDGVDANHGLSGLRPNNEHERYAQNILQFSESAEGLVDPPHENRNAPWHRRGWTFQERVLSGRCLVFQGGTVFWHCRRAKWWEEVAAEPEGIPTNECFVEVFYDEKYSLSIDLWPNGSRYWDFVESYSKRTLTFETDVPRAFAAIIDVMSRSFPGGFHWGIPAFYFDISLLWRNSLPLQRRANFPSWSWMGWKGELTFNHFQIHYKPDDDPLDPTPNKFQTMNKWYICKEQHGERVQINNSWQSRDTSRAEHPHALPRGWSSKSIKITGAPGAPRVLVSNDDEETDSDNDDCDDTSDSSSNRSDDGWQTMYYHHQFGRDKCFRYPVPIVEKLLGPFPDTWSPLLCFTTMRQRFVFGSSFNPVAEGRADHCLWIDIRNTNEKWAGVIESNYVVENDALALEGLQCEVILVSAGSVERRPSRRLDELWEMDLCDTIKSMQTYEFYNVLWIKWENGIAYREAIGRVWKEAWDMQTAEEIEVFLG